ncbi:arginine decarboxylase-like [Wolffia australiana]
MPAMACVDVAAAAAAPPAFVFSGQSAFDSPPAARWSPEQSADLYNIHDWGAPYFSVNKSGHISVRPHGDETLPHQEIDLMKVVQKASGGKPGGGLGLQLPLIVRFPDLLRNRLRSLQSAFDAAIRSNGYGSRYQGVYPVKCNQDRFVVEDIVEFGAPFGFGLEAGSKPELLLAMSCLTKGSPDGLLICNGYKDAEYVSLALTARRLDLNAVIVLEQEEELDTVLAASKALGVRPVVGLRAKLRTKHAGHFGSTSGEKGKFGLNARQVLSVARKLRQLDMLDCLQLLHFHIGSQIPCTDLLADGVGEAAHIFCELARLGADMRVIDVGGGLGIDYDGSRSGASDMSVCYSLEEYAAAVVGAIQKACDRKGIRHPVICSESGRALVSHHSVLVFEALSSTGPPALELGPLAEELGDEARFLHGDLLAAALANEEEEEPFAAAAERLKRRCAELFKAGALGLEQLAAAEGVCEALTPGEPAPRTYHVNLSVFTSVPDSWAIGQRFPVVPIHRLEQRPAARGVLSDLTCDSDGKLDAFIGGRRSLPLHEMGHGGGGYYLGMFLGGAYQEALGGLHNLFGGPSVVRVAQVDGPHGFAVTRAAPGPSCAEVLRMMQHEPELMFRALERRADERAPAGRDAVARDLARALQAMPYLVSSSAGPHHLHVASDDEWWDPFFSA